MNPLLFAIFTAALIPNAQSSIAERETAVSAALSFEESEDFGIEEASEISDPPKYEATGVNRSPAVIAPPVYEPLSVTPEVASQTVLDELPAE